MATSGTIGQTRLPTNRLLEKSMRRAGLLPAQITPEIVSEALESLFMFIMSLSSRGLNLWCIDHELIPLNVGQATYVLPEGTIDVLNLLHVTPTQLAPTRVDALNEVTLTFDATTTVVKAGLRWSVLPSSNVLLQSSDDGVSWTTVDTLSVTDFVADEYFWFELDPAVNAQYFKISSANLGTLDDVILADNAREIMMTPFNRDDWANQPTKTFQSQTQTNYYFEKLVAPQITIWPVPSSDERYMSLFRYRQIQDIGDLQNEIELPTRWYEAICWHLAMRIAFEIPGVDPQRRQEVVQMASTFTFEAEGNETDGAPVFFAPRISAYTR